MSTPTEQQIKGALAPATAALISSIGIDPDGNATVVMESAPSRAAGLEPIRREAEAIIARLPGIKSARVILTAERAPGAETARKRPAQPDAPLAPGVKHMIAVASGKGGVGKSTVAVNLAAAMAQRGLAVGLLDLDIYGPSVPRLTGLQGQKPSFDDDGKLIPFAAHGFKMMSMGFLVAEEAPMIWRGPMVQSAVVQLLRDVAWGNLDVLVIDMPPGTGDAQLTLAQKVPLAGAIIVSTPQDIALIDARKGLEMFRKVDVPVLGIIENMSMFCCPSCGHETAIFGHGGAEAEARRLQCPFLGAITLDPDIRKLSDEGTPIAASRPDSTAALVFRNIAGKVSDALQHREAERRVASMIGA